VSAQGQPPTTPDHAATEPDWGSDYGKLYLTRDAIVGLGHEVRMMRDTPAGKLELDKALKRIEDECARIARGDVNEKDLIG
jgi:hypothetical protein